MNNLQNSNHDDALDRAMRAYRSETVPDGPPCEFVDEMLAALHHAEEAAGQNYIITLKERILTMKLTTRITIAVTVLIAIGGLLAWLAPGGGTALAFTDLAEAFTNIRSATCKTSSEFESPQGKITTSGKLMYLAPSRERFEFSGPDLATAITITDNQKGEGIVLSPKMKTAMVFKFENLPTARREGSFDQLRRLVSSAQSDQADRIERLGHQMIHGRKAVGFRIPKADHEVEIWADPDTCFPVRVESISHREPKTRSVMSDFCVNMELDESLFSLEVPEGYTVNRVKMDASDPTAEDLAGALQVAAENNDGIFPAELHGVNGIMGLIFKAVNTKHGKDESPEKLKALSELSTKVGRGIGFVQNMTPDNNWHYAGKNVKLNSPNRPIFWCKPTGDKTYRVIYADLSIKEVAPADVPKIPQASGKR